MKRQGTSRRSSTTSKKKYLSGSDLQRKLYTRTPKERVLIVCEGEKTEPQYFNALIDDLRLGTAHVVIDSTTGSSPRTVVERARARYAKDEKGDPFDKVYCVIDRDEHPTFEEALVTLRQLKPKGCFKAIVSNPCFEYWILLHFTYTTKLFIRTGTKSGCDCIGDAVRQHYKDYQKGHPGVYSFLKDKLSLACNNATKSCAHCRTTGADGPQTVVHELVQYLQELSKP